MAMTAHSSGSPLVHSPNAVVEASRSAVSWPAIFAGAAAAAALSLILLILGTGLGLASVSPWAQAGISATTFGVTTILWITFTQLVASGMGGYLAGRLRTRWAGTQSDEVYFRDTAHGFLAWAVASLLTAALLTSAVASIVGGGVKAGATVAAGGAAAAGAVATQVADQATGGDGNNLNYFVDSLFRADGTGTAAAAPDNSSPAAVVAETTAILFNALRKGELPAADATYLSQRVALRTGISQSDAQKRVTDTFNTVQAQARDAENKAREAADAARKASSKAALWLFVSLLVGAFVASLSATFGGRQRDTD